MQGDWDFILTTYEFVLAQHQRLEIYNTYINAVREHGYKIAMERFREESLPTSKPTSALFSTLWRQLKRPFAHLVCDEVTQVKHDGKTAASNACSLL
jgi:hypothetical protein